MLLGEAQAMARGLMDAHGLDDWSLAFDNAKTRAGACRFTRRQISLSRILTRLHDETHVRDTVLHEIAHALVGPGAGHGPVWKEMARAVGCSATRCVPEDAPKAAAAWTGTCPAGHTTTAHRRPERVKSCGTCSPTFSPCALYEWRRHGQVVPMHGNYVAELKRIRARAGDQGPQIPTQPSAQSVSARLPVGTQVRLGGGGRYGDLVGTIEKRGRTRYHVRTAEGVLTAPFALVERI